MDDGKLHVDSEGTQRKFVREVEHRTFSGASARAARPARALRHRALRVPRWRADGLELIEIAPGIDIERDILAQMDFAPIDQRPAAADGGADLRRSAMNLRERMLAVPLEQRLAYDEEHNILFLNFERLSVKTSADVRRSTTRSSGG